MRGMATIKPISGDSSYQDAFNEMRQFVLNSFGVPATLLAGESSTLSQAVHLAFEQQQKIKLVGMEFSLNVMLDPLIEAGRQALAEFVAGPSKELRRQQAEQN